MHTANPTRFHQAYTDHLAPIRTHPRRPLPARKVRR